MLEMASGRHEELVHQKRKMTASQAGASAYGKARRNKRGFPPGCGLEEEREESWRRQERTRQAAGEPQ